MTDEHDPPDGHECHICKRILVDVVRVDVVLEQLEAPVSKLMSLNYCQPCSLLINWSGKPSK